MYNINEFLNNNKRLITSACNDTVVASKLLEEISKIESVNEKDCAAQAQKILKENKITDVTFVVNYYDINDIDTYNKYFLKE